MRAKQKVWKQHSRVGVIVLGCLVFVFSVVIVLPKFIDKKARAAAVCVDQGANDLYVDKDSLCGACSDSFTKAQNSVTQPWCTIQRAHTGSASEKVAAGNTVYVQDGHYNEHVEPTVNGTAGNLITYKALGTGAYISPATNLVDGNFVLVGGYTKVYSIALAASPSAVRQTYFYDILVDDPGNDSYYYLKSNDGPINLTSDQVVDNATVEAQEGTWRWDSGTLYVHPYRWSASVNDVAPSNGNTDLWAPTNTLALQVNANYIVVDGFKFSYAQSGSGVVQVTANKNNNVLRNLLSTNGGIAVYGDNTVIENTTVTHGHTRQKGNGSEGFFWSWSQGSSGGGFTLQGTGNTLRNSTAFQNWNNIGMESTTTNATLDRVTIHDTPNHCLQTKGVNLTLRNTVAYNCQDDMFYLDGTSNGVYENNTTFGGGIGFQESVGLSISNLTFRNNIHNGCNISYVYVNDCSYEAEVTVANSIFLCAPGENLMIEHCTNPAGPGTNYTLAAYQAACTAGSITGCMTLSNISVITSGYTNVIAGGRWVGDLSSSNSWDVHIPNASSPARNTGSASTSATTDYEGDVRPLGGAYDIGADEYNENAVPVLAAIGNRTIFEQDILTLNLVATDADPGNTLTFSATNRPTGSTFTDNGNRTATFTWQPSLSQSGSYPNMQFTVSDGIASDSETITITVNDGISACTPNWSCTGWSTCASSLQSRTCSDLNSCGTDAGRPAQSQSCDSTAPGRVTDLMIQ